MRLQYLLSPLLLTVIEGFVLIAARPGLAQTNLNEQLRQALCAQNWGQALEVLDQIQKAAGREYASQINLYRARVQVLARDNVKLSKLMDGCSAPSPPSSAPATNPIPAAPNTNIPAAPNTNIPAAPNTNIPAAPNTNVLPVPSL